MKLFRASEIAAIDSYTIENEPVRSIDLMERAAGALFAWYTSGYDRSRPVLVFAGPGNNGGDGLALARMLDRERYRVTLCNLKFGTPTADSAANRDRLKETGVNIIETDSVDRLPLPDNDTVIIDGIFGTGLTRPATGLAAEVIEWINGSGNEVISIDIPSGLFGEENGDLSARKIVKARYTVSFQFPKLAFFMADCHPFTGEWIVLPIGLHPVIIREKASDFYTGDILSVAPLLKKPGRFDHKGVNGHALLVAGSCGHVGAAILAGRAALRAGTGLLTAHLPKPFADIMHTALPEAMVQCDQSEILISEVYNTERYDAVGAGPGIGTKPNTVKGMRKLLEDFRGPMVLDADALNILSANRDMLGLLTPGTILTPHPGEFDRLAGESGSSWERLVKQRELAAATSSIVVLKGAYTSIALPDGRVWFNMSGNPGMATAGSGDVLTGVILGLLARGYSAADAAIAGVFIHGLAGDIAVEETGTESLIASDIINNIGKAFIHIRKETK